MKKPLLISLALLFSTQLFAQSSVWKAEKDGATVYLGGTIHVLLQSDYPLPEEFAKAYQAAEIVTFETDISRLQDPALAQVMMQKLSYNDARTLNSQVSAETYQKLNDYAQGYGIKLEMLKNFKPGLVMSTFLGLELQKMGATAEGIDAHFLNQAKRDGKQTFYLETIEQQMDFLARMGVGKEDHFYQNMLRDFTQMQQQMSQIIRHWRTGDSRGLDAFANQPMAKDYPEIFQFLLIDRNNQWMPSVEQYFTTKEVEFVMVGAAHLVGEHGLIAQLKAKGYQVTQL